jgi:protein-S-isoprenylcysteine O-methyltransferase Ste14
VLGIALTFASPIVAWYAVFLMAVFHVRVVRFEEPWLARTFPDDWRRYAAGVRRWWPRTKPWE